MTQAGPKGQLEMAARFAPFGARGGVFLSPGFAPPFGWEWRSIVTVHDLHYLDRTIGSPRQHWYFSKITLPQLRRCRLVLTVSESSAAEIRAALGSAGPEVVIVGNGVDPALLAVRQDRPVQCPRLLFVGGDKSNKNLPRALVAFARVQAAMGAELVVIGAVADDVVRAAPRGVVFVGSVPEHDLAEWYGRSTALLMPSIAEGFGLPALEAIVAGTPVIYGDFAALPEVVGRHGWPVDPLSVESIAAGIEAAVQAPIEITTAEREASAASHRWSDVARRVIEAVEPVA